MKLFQYLTRRQKVCAVFSVTVTIILLILDLILILSLRDTVTSTNQSTSTSPPIPTSGVQSTSASTSASTFSSLTSDQSSTDSSPSSTDTDTTSVTSEQSTTISSTTATTSVATTTTTAPVEQVLFVNDEQIFKLPSFEKLESSECDVTNANSHDGSLGVAGIVHDENMDLRLLIGGFTSVDYWYVRTETGWIQVESSRQER